MLVRPSARARNATCLQDLPADAPTRGRGAYITRGTSSVYTYRAVAGGRVGTMRRRAWRSAQNERQWVRCADAPTRQHGTRRIQFARALASQRPPSRERPSLGGGGAGRALFPSLWLSPLSLSLDRRRGAPSSSSKRSARVQLCWHITPGAAAAAAAAKYIQESQCRRSRG